MINKLLYLVFTLVITAFVLEHILNLQFSYSVHKVVYLAGVQYHLAEYKNGCEFGCYSVKMILDSRKIDVIEHASVIYDIYESNGKLEIVMPKGENINWGYVNSNDYKIKQQ